MKKQQNFMINAVSFEPAKAFELETVVKSSYHCKFDTFCAKKYEKMCQSFRKRNESNFQKTHENNYE